MQADRVHVFMFSSQVQRFVVGKSAAQDTTLTLYLLGRAQDFLGRRLQVVRSSGFVKKCIPIIFLNLIERI